MAPHEVAHLYACKHVCACTRHVHEHVAPHEVAHLEQVAQVRRGREGDVVGAEVAPFGDGRLGEKSVWERGAWA